MLQPFLLQASLHILSDFKYNLDNLPLRLPMEDWTSHRPGNRLFGGVFGEKNGSNSSPCLSHTFSHAARVPSCCVESAVRIVPLNYTASARKCTRAMRTSAYAAGKQLSPLPWELFYTQPKGIKKGIHPLFSLGNSLLRKRFPPLCSNLGGKSDGLV